MMLLIIFSSILVYLIYTILYKPTNYWKERNVPYIKPVPIFGNMLPAVLQQISFFQWILDLYKHSPNEKYIGIFDFTKPQLVIRDIDLLKRITIKDFDNFINRNTQFAENLDPVLTKNLFFLTDQKWRDTRTTLSPTFTSNKMKFIYQLMYECAQKFSEHFKDNQSKVQSLEMKDVFSRFANDVIATSAFGITTDSVQNKDNEFFLNGKKLATFSRLKMLTVLLYSGFPFLKKIVIVPILSPKATGFFNDVIKETLKLRREKNIVRPDMIHLLLQSQATSSASNENANQKQTFTDSDIAAQGMIFFIAGFDTVSTALSFLTYELALNEDVQKRLQEEIDSAMENCEGQVPYEVLMNLKYLDMVISESLRKWPPAAAIDRICSNDYKIDDNLTICKGVSILIPINAIHRDPNIFPNPDIFDPERFSEENKHKIVSGSYIPFGSGPRSCIASRFALMELKVVIFHLLYEFDIIPVEKTQIPLVISAKQFIPSVDNGIWLGFKNRYIN